MDQKLHQPGATPDFAMSGVDPQSPLKPGGRAGHLEIAGNCWPRTPMPTAGSMDYFPVTGDW